MTDNKLLRINYQQQTTNYKPLIVFVILPAPSDVVEACPRPFDIHAVRNKVVLLA